MASAAASAPPATVVASAPAELPSVLKVDAGAIRIPEAEPTEEYHVGTVEGSPFQNVTLGGISFPRFTGGAAVGDPQRKGARVRLSPSALAAIKKAVARKVCRWRNLSDGSRVGVVMNTDSLSYRPQVGDEWLAKYVYCVRIAPEVAKIMDSEPATMA